MLFKNETPFRSLVRFKGMIQDMLNPEYFNKTITIFNSINHETIICQGKFHSNLIDQVSVIIFKTSFVKFIYTFKFSL